jgi:periplasmic divalent cation tolerance protein
VSSPDHIPQFLQLFVTCQSKKEAHVIAASLLRKRMVACANILPGISSEFWWKGRIDKAKEVLLILKSVNSNFKKIEKEVKRLHSYEVPEIVAIPIIAGSKEYLGWIKKEAR